MLLNIATYFKNYLERIQIRNRAKTSERLRTNDTLDTMTCEYNFDPENT